MKCPICGADAEVIPSTIDGVTVVWPMCGEYDVARSVAASGQLQRLEPSGRGKILAMARRSAQPGVRPVITTYLLG